MYKRFKWNPEIRYSPCVFLKLGDVPIGGKVFVGSTHELFLSQYESWTKEIIHICSKWDDRIFIFLTKRPENLIKYSPFPDNCYIGVSVCNDKMLDVAVDKLEDIQAKVKFISFEPLLERLTLSLDYAFYYSGINWLIIGQCTPARPATAPKIAWIKEIVDAADKAGIPVFLKDNLLPLLAYDKIHPGMGILPDWAKARWDGKLSPVDNDMRQEFPK